MSTNLPTQKDTINLNTVLLMILMGLSAWTLKKVVDLSENQAVLNFRVHTLENKMGTIIPSMGRPPVSSSSRNLIRETPSPSSP